MQLLLLRFSNKLYARHLSAKAKAFLRRKESCCYNDLSQQEQKSKAHRNQLELQDRVDVSKGEDFAHTK